MRNVDWQVLILTFQMIMQISKCYALKFVCPPLCKLKIWLRRCNRLWKRNTTLHSCPILEIKYIVFTSGVMEFQSPKLNSEGFYLYQVKGDLNLYLFATFQLNCALGWKINQRSLNFRVMEVWGIPLRIQSHLWKKYTYLVIFNIFWSKSVEESVCVNVCWFRLDNISHLDTQSKFQMFALYIFRAPCWWSTEHFPCVTLCDVFRLRRYTRRVFISLLDVWKPGQTKSFLCEILLTQLDQV